MLLEAIEQNCRLHGEKAAYRTADGALTYAELWRQASLLAGELRVGSGPVLVYGHKSVGMPVAFLACLLAGRAYVPCDVSLPPRRLALICRGSGASCAVACAPLPETWGGPDKTVIPLQELPPCGDFPSPEPPHFPYDESRAAYLLFTSGSTGTPKGVRVTLGNLENFVRWLCAIPAVRACADGVVFNQALFSFDLSVADLWPVWAAGGTVYAAQTAGKTSLEETFRAMRQSGAARLTCTPTFARLCLCDRSFSRALMPSLQSIFFCGEVLPPRTVRALKQRFPGVHVLNAYGPTEATCAVCAVEVDGTQDPLPVGETVSAAAGIQIADEYGQPAAPGQSGQIVLTGPSVAAGYVNAPSGGFTYFCGERAYNTGDSGYLRDGLLYCTGRLDRQIKYKGYRIEPDEVEAALCRWPEVRAAAVLPLRRGNEVRGLAAFLEWQGTPLSPEQCAARLRETLPPYLCPRLWRNVNAMPRNANGKCDRSRLEAMLG